MGSTAVEQATRATTRARWRGQAGRMEVWYATLSEPDGTGWWLHYERLAPRDSTIAPFAHGWIACFPVDGEPRAERFGPAADAAQATSIEVDGCSFAPGAMRGATGTLAWDLAYDTSAPTVYTFPRWTWEREVLPGAQVVDVPLARFTGTVTVDGVERTIEATGAQAHIFSHGNAPRWGWLHADLGLGSMLEVVAAKPHLPPPLGVAPRAFVQLRLDGIDVPTRQTVPALASRTSIAMPEWTVQVGVGGARRLRVEVSQPVGRCVQLAYPNPDGTLAWCTNTERADALVLLERKVRGAWALDRRWSLDGTAHAEVGAHEPTSDAVEVLAFDGAPVGFHPAAGTAH